jgi:hypothetical protein
MFISDAEYEHDPPITLWYCNVCKYYVDEKDLKTKSLPTFPIWQFTTATLKECGCCVRLHWNWDQPQEERQHFMFEYVRRCLMHRKYKGIELLEKLFPLEALKNRKKLLELIAHG